MRNSWGSSVTAGVQFRQLVTLCLIAFAVPAWSNSAVEPEKRTGRSYKRFLELNERIAERSPRVIFVGDSITHFWEVTGHELWTHYVAPFDAVNLGISGDRTEHVIWRLQNGNIDGIQPEAAVVMIGTNNLVRNTAVEIAKGIVEIVDILHARFPEMEILLYAIFPRANLGAEFIDKIPVINSMLAEHPWPEQVRYRDIGEQFLDENGAVQREIMFDHLHLTRRAYKVWAEHLHEELSDMLTENPSDTD